MSERSLLQRLVPWDRAAEPPPEADRESALAQVELLLEGDPSDELTDLLEELHPADLAALLDELSEDKALLLFHRLGARVAGEVLVETSAHIRPQLIDALEDSRLAELLGLLPVDDAVEFISDLPETTRERVLGLMHPEEAREVRHLMAYKGETAGRLMTTDVAALRRDWSVADALDYLRSLSDSTETLHYLYVVDRDRTLVGVVPIRTLVIAKADARIESIMETDVATVPVGADQEELAERIAHYNLVAMPVVDAQRRLLGVVTVDDVLDVVEEEATEDIQRLGGSQPLAQPYFNASPWQLARKRIVWILPLFFASVATDLILHQFEGILAAAVALTLFIPAVTGTAGNAGSQAVTTIIRGIATGEIRYADLFRAWMREAAVALLLGAALGAAGYLRAVTLGTPSEIAFVLAVTLPIVVLVANSLATIVPLVADRLGIDPTVISAPMITTIVDATGVLIYLTIATVLLGG